MMADSVRIPPAGEPMSDAQLQAVLRRSWAPGTLDIAVTVGPERLGHAIISITDVPSDAIERAVELVAQTCPRNWQLHRLDGANLVTIEGTKP